MSWTQDMWDGWPRPPLDEFFRNPPAKTKKKSRSVELPELTVVGCQAMLPMLQQFEHIRLAGSCEPAAVELLAQLPALIGVDLHVVPCTPELLQAVCRLPHLQRLMVTDLTADLLGHLPLASGLTDLALRDLQDADDISLAPLAELPQLRDLRISGRTPPGQERSVLTAEAFQSLAQRGVLRQVQLYDLSLDQSAIEALLSNQDLEVLRLWTGEVPTLRVVDHARLREFRYGFPLGDGELARLPALQVLELYGGRKLVFTDLPLVTSLSFYAARELVITDLPRLRKLRESTALSGLQLTKVPRLTRVEAVQAKLPEEQRAALERALPKTTFLFEKVKYKRRKKTAPKRKLKKGDWTHPQLGVEDMSFALVVAGRCYEEDLKLAKGKELGGVAEHWSQELGQHLTGVLPYDLTRQSGAFTSADELAPVVVGKVLAMVSANDGPSAPLTAADLSAGLDAAGELPLELWQEAAGVVGNAALEELPLGLFLVATGPLATAVLAQGELVAADVGEVIQGQDFNQEPHAQGVKGTLIEETGEVAELDLEELPAGPLYVIAAYD